MSGHRNRADWQSTARLVDQGAEWILLDFKKSSSSPLRPSPDHGVTEARQPGQKWKARPVRRLPHPADTSQDHKARQDAHDQKGPGSGKCRVTGSLFRPPVLPVQLPAKRGPSSGSNVEICQVLSKTVKYRYIPCVSSALARSPPLATWPRRTGAAGFIPRSRADASAGGLAVVIFGNRHPHHPPRRVRRQTGR